MFKALQLTIYPEDKYNGFPPPVMGQGSIIKIYRAMSVNITDAKKTNTYRTWQKNIGTLLEEKGIELGKDDKINPAANSALKRDMNIIITRVAETDIDEFASVPFKKITKNDPNVERGNNRIEQSGKNGRIKKTYHVRREDGIEVSRKLIKTETVEEPINEITIIGTGPKLVHSGPYMDELNNAAKKYQIDATSLACLMRVESGGSADAGYPDANYKGLFQYGDGFWSDISSKAGYGGSSIYNGAAQIYTTAYALTHGYSGRWPTWGRCRDK